VNYASTTFQPGKFEGLGQVVVAALLVSVGLAAYSGRPASIVPWSSAWIGSSLSLVGMIQLICSYALTEAKASRSLMHRANGWRALVSTLVVASIFVRELLSGHVGGMAEQLFGRCMWLFAL
jgi:hypothetical protein